MPVPSRYLHRIQYYIRSDDMIRTFHKLTITIPFTVPQIAFFFHFLFILSLEFCAPPNYIRNSMPTMQQLRSFPFLAFTLKILLIT